MSSLPNVPDLILTNAKVYTVNESQPLAQAVAIRKHRFVAVGSHAEILSLAGDATTIIDLDEAMMLPGFQDPHLHVLEAGLNENLCLVSDVAEFDEYIDEILDCADQQPESEWVRAAGANMADLLHRERLPIDVLDEAIPDRPAVVSPSWTATYRELDEASGRLAAHLIATGRASGDRVALMMAHEGPQIAIGGRHQGGGPAHGMIP